MSTDKLLTAALRYAEFGYPVFPCGPDKKPLTKNGFKDGTTDPNQLRAWWAKWPEACIGLATAGLVVIDRDVVEGADNPWPTERPQWFNLADAPTSCTPRGGRHHVFRRPDGVKWRCSTSKLAPKVDVRTDGGYIVVAPSVAPAGEYAWVEGQALDVPASELPLPPEWLKDALNAIHPPAGKVKSEPVAAPRPMADAAHNPTRLGRAERYIDRMPEAVSGQGGHGKTYAVAAALVNGFGIDEETAYGIMAQRYNPRCRPEWSERELRHKVSDAASKEHERPRGYLRDEPLQRQHFDDVDLSAFSVQGESPAATDEVDEDEDDLTELLGGPEERQASGPEDPGPFPAHLLEVPGFVGEVAKYNLDTAFRKQPVLALAGALCLQGVIAGRKVRDRSGTRTNIYCISLAPTGMGKDHARRINKQILFEAGLGNLEGAESVASHAAIESAVADTPAILFQFDEFGRFLATLSDAQRSPHLFGIIDVLMKLFTSAGGIYRARAYATKENNKTVNQPCAVLHATTVEDSFLRSLTRENVSDGLLGRVLIFEGERQPPFEYEAIEQPVPDSIIRTATWWRDFQSEMNLAGINPDPIMVETVDEADLVFRALVSLADREFGFALAGCELWTRALEKARKLALIYACSANHERPAIDGHAALWASEVVQYMTRRMIYLADRWIADGRFDAIQKEVMRKVEKRGGRVSHGDMCRVILRRMKSRDRDEILRNMLETGQIRRIETKSKTKPGSVYEVA